MDLSDLCWASPVPLPAGQDQLRFFLPGNFWDGYSLSVPSRAAAALPVPGVAPGTGVWCLPEEFPSSL